MELYQQLTLISTLLITHWTMGYICYKIGRKIQRSISYNLETRNTELKIENGRIQRELDNAGNKIKLLEGLNEQIYEEGKRDQIRETVKEMISDREQLSFEKISQKKSIKEGGEEDANNIINRAGSSVHILLDDLHIS